MNAAAGAPLLRFTGVEKGYAGRQALAGVDLEVEPGEILVLLGPNGAGKSTLLGTACGRIRPDAGEVVVSGDNPRTTPRVRAALGFVPQSLALYPYLSVRENLETFARMMGVPAGRVAERVADQLRWSGLEDRAASRADALSGGMQRRLNIVASLMHEPRVLLLDEPTVGVDIVAAERIVELLKSLRADGLGMLLTTHDLELAERLADRVALILDGRIHAVDTPAALVSAHFGDARELTIVLAETPAEAGRKQLETLGLAAMQGANTWRGPLRLDAALGELTQSLTRAGLIVTEIRLSEPGLAGVFVAVTGRELA